MAHYSEDGIHYDPDGYIERAKLIAAGLVSAFPGDQPLPKGGPGVASEGSEDAAEAGQDCLVGPSEGALQIMDGGTGLTGTTGATGLTDPAEITETG